MRPRRAKVKWWGSIRFSGGAPTTLLAYQLEWARSASTSGQTTAPPEDSSSATIARAACSRHFGTEVVSRPEAKLRFGPTRAPGHRSFLSSRAPTRQGCGSRRSRSVAEGGHVPDPSLWYCTLPEVSSSTPGWKRRGSGSRPDYAHSDPRSGTEMWPMWLGPTIRPSDARVRALFASRRSPVRSRLAP